MNLKFLFGSIMAILFFNGCVAATENLSSTYKEDLVPRTPITPRTPIQGSFESSQTASDKLDNSEKSENVNKTVPRTPITPRTPIQGSFESSQTASDKLDNSEKSENVNKTVPRTPITPRTLKIGTFESLETASDNQNNSENPKILNNISILKDPGENFPREKIEANPLLTKPKIAKIKIRSYIDSDGDYHETSTVHMLIKESEFIENKKYFSINEE